MIDVLYINIKQVYNTVLIDEIKELISSQFYFKEDFNV